MPDVLWYAALGANLGAIAACWYTVGWYVRRLRADEQTCFLRWQAIEAEQAQAWLQLRREVQAACPLCGLATAEPPDDTLSA